jgi:hypothetical protein
MVAEAVTWVDVRGPIRAWARDNVESADRRVFLARSDQAPLPQIVLFRIGGPDSSVLIQFDCLARSEAEAEAVAADLCTQIDSLARYEHDGVLLTGAAVESSRGVPDPDTNDPRFIVDATFVVSAAA